MNKAEFEQKFKQMKLLKQKLEELGAITLGGDPDHAVIQQGNAKLEDIEQLSREFGLAIYIQNPTISK